MPRCGTTPWTAAGESRYRQLFSAIGRWVGAGRVKEMPSAKRNRRQIAKVEASGEKAG